MSKLVLLAGTSISDDITTDGHPRYHSTLFTLEANKQTSGEIPYSSTLHSFMYLWDVDEPRFVVFWFRCSVCRYLNYFHRHWPCRGWEWMMMMGLWFWCRPLFGHNCAACSLCLVRGLRAQWKTPSDPLVARCCKSIGRWVPQCAVDGFTIRQNSWHGHGTASPPLPATSDLLASGPNKQSIRRVFKCLPRKQ